MGKHSKNNTSFLYSVTLQIEIAAFSDNDIVKFFIDLGCHLISWQVKGIKQGTEELEVPVAWNCDGLAKRFSCED